MKPCIGPYQTFMCNIQMNFPEYLNCYILTYDFCFQLSSFIAKSNLKWKQHYLLKSWSTNLSSIVNKDCFTRIDKKKPEDFVKSKKKYAHQKYVILLNNNDWTPKNPPRHFGMDNFQNILNASDLPCEIFYQYLKTLITEKK